MPLVRSSTTLSLRAIMVGRSRSTDFSLMPCAAKLCFASSNFSEDWSSAFEGMQPIFRQVPPSRSRFSTQATVMPSWAARIAAV